MRSVISYIPVRISANVLQKNVSSILVEIYQAYHEEPCRESLSILLKMFQGFQMLHKI